MLEVESLSVSMRDRTIVREVSFGVAPGRVCALIGPNGAGKSTLIKAVSGLIPHSAGRIRIDGAVLNGQKRRVLAQKLSYLPQNTTPVPCSVFDAVLLGRKPYIHWRPGAQDRGMAEEVMEEMGLSPMRDACVTQVSGGEFQKILIARSLVQGAKVLLLDEPINHLDIKNQIEIMELIRTFTRRKNLATVIVLHDLNLAVRYADTILLIQAGRPLFHGDSGDISCQELSRAYDVDVSIRDIDRQKHVLY